MKLTANWGFIPLFGAGISDMSQSSDDTVGCIIGVIAIIGGGIWLYNNYEVTRKTIAPAPVITPMAVKAARPSGELVISTDRNGSKWVVEADSVSGARNNRQGWARIDSSKDKTTDVRETRRLYLVDCGTTAARTLSEATYGPDGKNLTSASYELKEAKVEYYPPNTMGEAIVRTLCDRRFDP